MKFFAALILILAKSNSSPCMDQAISAIPEKELAALLSRNRSNIRLANAVLRVHPQNSQAKEIVDSDVVGEMVRKDFVSFTWRSRAHSTVPPIPKERSFSTNRKDADSFVPIAQYLMLGAMTLGLVALGSAAWMLLKKGKE